MTDDRQDRIRKRAHAIWETSGRPEGSDREHWEQATRDIEAEDYSAKAKKPAAAKAAPAKAAAKPKAVAKAPAAKKPAAKSKSK
ncbi:MAG: DUF2934 domain-containing protein [Hyphomicrobiales bacterium]|nr:DUF2934 domain-containing protein [Hyphomicrobiales bacterium]